ncbi:hypothetical protein [Halonotius roseus]|uniref:Phage tail sheath protein n=1 Tax=Halonotius roseus TaxID=2511997 RepID=A0A544QQZ1_9EURY|nr:hypothetical protein [Halonotius roseus]TQQ81851.1 hypothetical protein EWF95_02635 [Halonotius roseus]
MVSIGNTILPGVQTNIESADSTAVNIGAPGQIGLVGEADLANGTATANELEIIRTPVKARTLFGAGSQLAENVVQALTEGAYPVYAVAAEAVEVVGEDLSGLASTSGVLENAPVSESPSEVAFSVDGTGKDAVLTYHDPATETVGTDTVHYNPSSGAFELDAAPSTSGEVDYTYYDYDAATDALIDTAGNIVDVVGLLNENSAAVGYAHTKAVVATNRYEFMVVVAGAAPRIPDTFAYEVAYDSSRLQLLYPARTADDLSIIGAYCGLRASLGINSSPMFKRLSGVTDLAVTLSPDDQQNLIGQSTVPMADESRGARIVEDLTTVSDDNMDEASMRQVLHRLIVDYVTNIVNANSERYIGSLHKKSTRDALQGSITSELKRLKATDSITGFTIAIEEVDAMTASADVGIDTIDPLRNIVATISAGQIESDE